MGLSLPQNSFQLNFSSIYFMVMNRIVILVLMVCALMSACTGTTTQQLAVLPAVEPTQTFPAVASASLPTATQKPRRYSPITPMPTFTRTPTAAPTATPDVPERDPAEWKTWSVVPEFVDPSLQKVYERGQELGNDPHAFSRNEVR